MPFQNSMSAAMLDTFPVRQLRPIFQPFWLEVLLDWAHFETVIFSSTLYDQCSCITAAFGAPMINWNRLGHSYPSESSIISFLAIDQFAPRLPFFLRGPVCEKNPSVSWWVWMWKNFTTLLPLSKGSSCYVLLNIIWGVFLVWTMMSLWFSQTQHVGRVVLCGWGVMKLHWVKTPTHPSWISTTPMRCFITPLLSLCDFSWEKRFIVTPSQLLQVWGNEAAAPWNLLLARSGVCDERLFKHGANWKGYMADERHMICCRHGRLFTLGQATK